MQKYYYYKLNGLELPHTVFSLDGALVKVQKPNSQEVSKARLRLYEHHPLGEAKQSLQRVAHNRPKGIPLLTLEHEDVVKWIVAVAEGKKNQEEFVVYWGPTRIEDWGASGLDAELLWQPTAEPPGHIPQEDFQSHLDWLKLLKPAIQKVLNNKLYMKAKAGHKKSDWSLLYEEFWDWEKSGEQPVEETTVGRKGARGVMGGQIKHRILSKDEQDSDPAEPVGEEALVGNSVEQDDDAESVGNDNAGEDVAVDSVEENKDNESGNTSEEKDGCRTPPDLAPVSQQFPEALERSPPSPLGSSPSKRPAETRASSEYPVKKKARVWNGKTPSTNRNAKSATLPSMSPSRKSVHQLSTAEQIDQTVLQQERNGGETSSGSKLPTKDAETDEESVSGSQSRHQSPLRVASIDSADGLASDHPICGERLRKTNLLSQTCSRLKKDGRKRCGLCHQLKRDTKELCEKTAKGTGRFCEEHAVSASKKSTEIIENNSLSP